MLSTYRNMGVFEVLIRDQNDSTQGQDSAYEKFFYELKKLQESDTSIENNK